MDDARDNRTANNAAETDTSQDTTVIHSGRVSKSHHGAINPPVYHASTLLFPTVDGFLNRQKAEYGYGRRGTPTTRSLEDAVAKLECADAAMLTPSGKAANSTVFSAFAEPGAHYLITDSAYFPSRKFCSGYLSQIGVEAEFYDPRIGSGIEKLIRPETKLIWLESPGSQTFEIQDVPAIVAAAKSKNVATALDNTWGAGYFLKPLTMGVDVSVQAATKYLGGHSDLMMGTVATSSRVTDRIKNFYGDFGLCVAPDDAYLALRGIRTLGVRMTKHYESGMKVARWLAAHPKVAQVIHPGLETNPDHNLWQRDFTGASGLFGFILKGQDSKSVAPMLESLKFFGMGSSWGGYESLLIPTFPEKLRTATKWEVPGQSMRIHVGLEDPDDLIADLCEGFERLK